MDRLRVALLQVDAGADEEANLALVEQMARAAVEDGARLVALPELFHFGRPLAESSLAAEPLSGPRVMRLQGLARQLQVWLLAGSVLESSTSSKPFNTSLLLSPEGEVLGAYRKIHLFDVDLPGEVTYRESDWLTPGEAPLSIPLADTGWRVGLSICYDLRFPELYRRLVAEGANVLVAPAMFSAPTGRAHWRTLVRARAIENQCYVLACGQCGVKPGGYRCHGHSMVVDPWGEVIAEAGDEPGAVFAELHDSRLEEVRARLPVLSHRRL